MQYKAKDVATYIREAPADRQDALETQRPFLKGLSVGKGCIRYSRPDKIDFAVVAKLLAATRRSKGKVC